VSDERRDNSPLLPDEQYLWDGTGTPDPTTARVEESLASLRYRGELRAPSRAWSARSLRPLLVAAAVLLVSFTSYVLVTTHPKKLPPPAPTTTWAIASTTGNVQVGEPRPLKSTATLRAITVGEGGRVSLTAGPSSSVQVEGNATLEIGEGPDQFPWLTLTRGNIMAQVGSADQPLMVGVHANPITLKPGTAASITTTPDATQIICKVGEAHIQWPKRETRVLGPATCEIDARSGPSLPLSVLASKEACGAVEALDDGVRFMIKDPKYGEDMLLKYLDQSKPADAPTLWNLLHRVPPDYRREVRNALARHIGPTKVDPDLILKLDPAAMDAWWHAAVDASTRN